MSQPIRKWPIALKNSWFRGPMATIGRFHPWYRSRHPDENSGRRGAAAPKFLARCKPGRPQRGASARVLVSLCNCATLVGVIARTATRLGSISIGGNGGSSAYQPVFRIALDHMACFHLRGAVCIVAHLKPDRSSNRHGGHGADFCQPEPLGCSDPITDASRRGDGAASGVRSLGHGSDRPALA